MTENDHCRVCNLPISIEPLLESTDICNSCAQEELGNYKERDTLVLDTLMTNLPHGMQQSNIEFQIPRDTPDYLLRVARMVLGGWRARESYLVGCIRELNAELDTFRRSQ